ncbi:multidrug effflux MFS transporter [Alphaproteobacteria bacterium]|nr:multidrug effflux MFS transporter [Alphaproteobacteria bacterium]
MTTPGPPRYIFPLLAAITFIAPLANHMFLPAMPVIKQDFGIGNELAFATLSLTMMTMAFATLVYGGLADQWGRKQVLLAGLAIYTIGAEVCWFAPDIWTLLAGRILQGAGAGCGIVLARAIARDVYGMDRIASVIANLTAAYVIGPLVAPTIGGFLVGWEGWRFLFLIIIAIGLGLIAMVAFQLPETHHPQQDIKRFASIVRGTLQNYGQLMRVPRFNAYALMPGFMSGTFFSFATAWAFLARETLGLSTEEFGVWFLFLPAGFMFGNLMSGQIGNRASVTFMTTAGTILNLLIIIVLWLVHEIAELSILMMIIPGFVFGIAQGMCMPYSQMGAMQVNPSLAGSASGAVVFCQLFFAGAGEQTVGLLADGTLYPVMKVMFGFSIAAITTAIVAALTQPKRI